MFPDAAVAYLSPDLLNLKKKKKVGTSLVDQWLKF